MKRSIYKFPTVCLLAFLYHLGTVSCLSKIHKYNRVNALDGLKCTTSYIDFDAKSIISVIACLKLCSARTTCAGISYQPSAQQCIGCNELFDISDVTDIFDDSEFYQLDECPDGAGRVQPGINLRMRIQMEEKNKTDAESICEREPNGHLVILDEQWKINAVSNIMMWCAGYQDKVYWVDGTNQASISQWNFRDGGNMPMSQTTFWHTGEPNSATSGTACVRLMYRDAVDAYRFADKACHKQYAYICEY